MKQQTISRTIINRTTRATLARRIVSQPQHKSLTAQDAHALRLPVRLSVFEALYLSDTEMVVDLRKVKDVHYPFRAVVYTAAGEWTLDVPLAANAPLTIAF